MQTQRYKVTVRCLEFPVPVDCYVPAGSSAHARIVADECATRNGLQAVTVLDVGPDDRPVEARS
ncbi:hypothetical protein BM43_7593 (plasmid) [Burkholderia gladioli]|uniref:Uncharacterized protein n=1 Tax=Burkholderia gladioli TaxID=28095 RepID=A0AAW3FAK8_BURGA|nr:hypothetical protein BM43_7593 [Burkholderia gladioli]KGC24029.1 hypothetical protein DM48_8062 [Burkholderia gladioli]